MVLLLLAIAGSCRQQQSSPQSSLTASSPRDVPISRESSPPTTWPGLPQPSSASETEDSSSGQARGDGAEFAVITAQSSDAQVNVRSQPSQDAESIGYALVGDGVNLGRSEVAEDGHSWYAVTLQNTATAGWVRSDFLDIQSSIAEDQALAAVPQSDVLKEALDEHCGGPEAISAYFTTQNYIIYLCEVRGKLLYLSQEKGTSQVIVADETRALGGGYIIVNGNYEYRLDSRTFVVLRTDGHVEDTEIVREAVVHSERY
ncbi:MAG: SH3 domain-containing protein [Leptolyngbya sp. SIO1E4]|nr:SH3 domain-containing protein [Leptolyngbya sp. SIO1E4]